MFEFVDLAGNTWSYLAVVDRIYNGPITIWALTGFTFSTTLDVVNYEQTLEEQISDYFRVDDPNGYNTGFYTTISISDLSGSSSFVSAGNVYLQATWVDLLSGTINPRVYVNTALSTYQQIDSPVTYIQRDDWENSFVIGKYGVKPKLRITVPAYQMADEYIGVMTYTLYD